jgi:hypothetical protein
MEKKPTYSDRFGCEDALKFDLSEYYKRTEPVKPITPEELAEQLDKVIQCSLKHPLEKLTLWAFAEDAGDDHRIISTIRNKNELYGALMDASTFGHSIWYVFGGMKKSIWDGTSHFSVGLVLNKKDNYETNIVPEVLERLGAINWSK